MHRSRYIVCHCVVVLFASQAFAPVYRPNDFTEWAKSAPKESAKILRELAMPRDVVTLTDGTSLSVKPLHDFPNVSPIEAVVPNNGKTERRKIDKADIKKITYYEERALAKIDRFTDVAIAERALQAILWFHRSARNRPLDGDNPWEDIELRIRKRLGQTRVRRLDQVRQSAKVAAAWTAALAYAERIRATPQQGGAVRNALGRLWIAYAEHQINVNDWPAAGRIFARLENTYLDDLPGADALRTKLRERAAALAKQAEKAPDADATRKLETALTIWPRLPGAQIALWKRKNRYQILYVGVRQLPEFLSPETVWLDSEKQTLDLLFQRLIEPVYDANLGQRYLENLAEKIDRPTPYRYLFRLPADAFWSNGVRVHSIDVRRTVQLRAQRQDDPVWSEWIDMPQAVSARTIRFTLRQGLFQPRCYFTFPITPARFQGKELRHGDKAFAVSPIGSGPYRYIGRTTEGKQTLARFVANESYFAQPGVKPPPIHEVRMFLMNDTSPRNAIQNRLFLGADVGSDAALKWMNSKGVRHESRIGRRVHFLALNHRLPALANADLRRALAHAMDREALLDRHFRGVRRTIVSLGRFAVPFVLEIKPDVQWHEALNGPFPRKSWANCPPPRVPERLHNAALAKTYFRKAHKVLGAVSLTLLCPAGDRAVADACRGLALQCESVAKDAGMPLKIAVKILPPHELKRAVDERKYQLAYMPSDYPDATYRLWPLFYTRPNALGPGGANFLGYQNDGPLESLFREKTNHRDFDAIREATHSIHARLYERMPLIPLWRLHRHIIHSPQLHIAGDDADRIFARILDWRVDAR